MNIRNNKKLLEKLNKIRAKASFNVCCDFCGASSDDYVINEETVMIDGRDYVHFLCKHCGNSKFLLLEVTNSMDK